MKFTYSSLLLSMGDTFQDPPVDPWNHWTYVFSYAYVPMIKFNLGIRHSKESPTINNSKMQNYNNIL